MKEYVITNDNMLGFSTIQEVINDSEKAGVLSLTIKGGVWKISAPILLPSFFYLKLDNCVIEANGKLAITNSFSQTTYGRASGFNQRGITVVGQGTSEIQGSVLFSNADNCKIENLVLTNVSEGYAVKTVSTHTTRVKDLIINNCDNGIIMSSGSREGIYTNISGQVDNAFITITDAEDLEKVCFPRTFEETMNNLIDGVKAKAGTLFRIYVNPYNTYTYGVERTIITNVEGEVKNIAFDVDDMARHITIENYKISGKVKNKDYSEINVKFY